MLFVEISQENVYITHSVGLHAEMSYIRPCLVSEITCRIQVKLGFLIVQLYRWG